MRDLRFQLTQSLNAGHIVSCIKIKHQKGKCNITLGRHQTAVPVDEKFALYINNEQHLFTSARGAVDRFVNFVGSKTALAAFKRLDLKPRRQR